MGISVDVWSCPYSLLRDAYLKMGADDSDKLDQILDICGRRLPHYDMYIFLNDEHYDNESPYYALMGLLEAAWPAMVTAEYEGWEGAQGPLLELRSEFCPNYVDLEDVREKLGLEPEDQ